MCSQMAHNIGFLVLAIIVCALGVLSSPQVSNTNESVEQVNLKNLLKDVNVLEDAIHETNDAINDVKKDPSEALLSDKPGKTEKDTSSLVCPEHVKRFSSGPRDRSYYSCEKAGDVPVLQQCADGEVYYAAKGICIGSVMDAGLKAQNDVADGPVSDEQDDGSGLKTFSEPVMGRSVVLGCLYDAKSNMIMTSDSFWSPDTIKKNKVTRKAFSSDVSFFAAQTTFERLSKMDIKASLQLEFMGGLVKVSGSAAYLNDKVESSNTVAFVMKAHYDTRTEILPTATKKDYNDLCSIKGPTHVVTSIHYGMDAYFTFTKTAKSHESKEKLSGSLKVVVKSIPGTKIEGKAQLKIEGSLKEKIKNIDVKLRGDFILPVQPTTYEESIRTFKGLTSHLGTKPEYANSKEMKMTLTPIKRFCDASTALLIGISETLIHSATTMLDELERTKLGAQTLARTDAVRKYIPLQNIINKFITKLDTFVLSLKADLQTILPKIRGGGANSSEKELVALITKYKKSPFNYARSKSFLKVRRRELETIDAILNWKNFQTNNIQVIDYEDANDNKILLSSPLVVMVEFNVLSDMTVMNRFLGNGTELDESLAWFNRDEVIAKMGKTLNAFTRFASDNKDGNCGYLFKTGRVKSRTITVYAQKDGATLTDSFEFPKRPSKIRKVANKYNSISFELDNPNNIWIKEFEMKYWKVGREGGAITKTFPFSSKNNGRYEIDDLEPNNVYMYTTKYVTQMGKSRSSPLRSVLTRPSSPPPNLKIEDVSATSFKIYWDRPLHIGTGVQISHYKVIVTYGTQYLYVTTTKTWAQAERHCVGWNGHLAIITSQEINNHLLSGMKNKNMYRSWIGLSDSKKEGSFKWVDRTVYNTYTNWKRRQPDGGRNENCAEMINHAAWNGKWNDNRCSFKNQFICQRSNPNGDQVVKRQRVNGDRQTATFRGLGVATRYSINVQAFADNKQYNVSGRMKRLASRSEKSWISTLTEPEAPQQPRTVNIKEHSVQITWAAPRKIAVGAQIQEYVVRYSLMNNKGDAIVTGQTKQQSSRTSTSVTIGSLVQGSTYSLSVKVVTTLGASNFSPALIVKTTFKQTELDVLRKSVSTQIQQKVSDATSTLGNSIQDAKTEIKAMEEVMSMAHIFYPQGTKDHLAQRMYSQYEGAKFVGYGYFGSYSAAKQYTNYPLQSCLITCAYHKKSHGYNGFYYAWASKYCVCLKDDAGHQTAKGFLHYRFHDEPAIAGVEYKFVKTLNTWTQAEAECKRWNGHLATVMSSAQNTHIQGELKKRNMGNSWIGLTDSAAESKFKWVDPANYNTYTNWKAGEPNGGTRENCAMVYTSIGKWNDAVCNSRYGFVCQKRQGTPEVSPLLSAFPIQTSITRNNRLTTFAVLGMIYDISLEVLPTSFKTGYTNIFHMSISRNNNVYGARIPGIWFKPSSPSATTDRLHVTNAISGNKNYYFDTAPLPRNNWVKIRLTQVREGSKYVYRIFINDKEVRKTDNNQPKIFYNVKVYASDPWASTQPGYIRNLRISDDTNQPKFTI